MHVLVRVIDLFRRESLVESIKIIFRHIHGLFPRRIREYCGVRVKDAYLFDRVLPWQTDANPHHESGIIRGIEERVKPSDRVVIVGGGRGVTAIRSAQAVGSQGRVNVFEGARGMVRKAEQTAKLNGVEETIAINHAIVGSAKDLSGPSNGAAKLSPADLPDCDVLELDCEGAEIEILSGLNQRPRVVIVETHGMYEAPSSEVEWVLDDMGYTVVRKEVANKGMEKQHIRQDVYVITALSNSDGPDI